MHFVEQPQNIQTQKRTSEEINQVGTCGPTPSVRGVVILDGVSLAGDLPSLGAKLNSVGIGGTIYIRIVDLHDLLRYHAR